jgi:hypothetical protein
MTVHLEPGRFYAGIDLPFFITRAMVQHKLEGLGFTDISFHDRSEAATALRVDPKKYPAYDDGWTEWLEATYSGPKKDLPADKHWSWLLVVPAGSAPIAPPSSGSAPTAPASKPGLSASAVVVTSLVFIVGLVWLKGRA